MNPEIHAETNPQENLTLAQNWLRRFSDYIEGDYKEAEQRFYLAAERKAERDFQRPENYVMDLSKRTCLAMSQAHFAPHLEADQLFFRQEYGVVQSFAERVAEGNTAIIDELAGYEAEFQEQFDTLLR